MMKIHLDVGCHIGECSFLWCKSKENMVYAFEPNPELFEKLKAKEKLTENFMVFPYAICEHDGEMEFNINENPATSSLKDFEDISYKHVKKIVVQTKRLDTFCDEMGIQSVHLLKSDAQGSDLDVLKSMGEKIDICEKIVVEAFITQTNTYVEEVKRNHVLDYLIPRGFTLVSESVDGNYSDLSFKKNKKNEKYDKTERFQKKSTFSNWRGRIIRKVI